MTYCSVNLARRITLSSLDLLVAAAAAKHVHLVQLRKALLTAQIVFFSGS